MDNPEAFVWRTHAYINDYIRLADAKAGALFAVFGALVGVLVRQWAEGNESLTWWRMALFAAALASNAVVLIAALLVVTPRTKKGEQGYVFWEHIRARSAAQYIEAVRELDDEGLYRAVASHTYEIAGVAYRKYRILKLAFWVSFPALALSLLALPTL
jgi:hypothetical protein